MQKGDRVTFHGSPEEAELEGHTATVVAYNEDSGCLQLTDERGADGTVFNVGETRGEDPFIAGDPEAWGAPAGTNDKLEASAEDEFEQEIEELLGSPA